MLNFELHIYVLTTHHKIGTILCLEIWKNHLWFNLISCINS